ncbi:MAG: hypothetical protein IAI50_01550 [Candidatus Eremiobacteraeota bacterium]|nr:hypothetical protein [Candidatus Eremiobacteraeota bacterium]
MTQHVSPGSATFVTACPTATCRKIRVVSVGFGQACNVNGTIGPPSYLAQNIGRSGVPKLTASQRNMIRAISRYVRSKTLRFAFVGPDFLIYDAYDGPCNGSPYAVLNLDCADYFSPTDFESIMSEGTKAGFFAHPGACPFAPRPWIPGDPGNVNARPWTQYVHPS